MKKIMGYSYYCGHRVIIRIKLVNIHEAFRIGLALGKHYLIIMSKELCI